MKTKKNNPVFYINPKDIRILIRSYLSELQNHEDVVLHGYSWECLWFKCWGYGRGILYELNMQSVRPQKILHSDIVRVINAYTAHKLSYTKMVCLPRERADGVVRRTKFKQNLFINRLKDDLRKRRFYE